MVLVMEIYFYSEYKPYLTTNSSPEALLKYKCCDFTLDSWSAGTILAAMMYEHNVPFDNGERQFS